MLYYHVLLLVWQYHKDFTCYVIYKVYNIRVSSWLVKLFFLFIRCAQLPAVRERPNRGAVGTVLLASLICDEHH